jgi:basic membrane protein A
LRGGFRMAALVAVAALALAGCGGKSTSGGSDEKKSVKVGLAYDIGGRGDKSFNDAAYAGLQRVKKELDVQTKDLSAKQNEPESDKEERLRLLAEGGFNPVIAVGFAYAAPLKKVAAEFPDTKFQLIDEVVEAPNVSSATFAAEQGSFLVGAAAALKTKTNSIGFVGGCVTPLIESFEAGYVAGAKAAKPGIKIQSKYLSTTAEKCSGFSDPAAGRTTATGMYEAGADIVYQAAGGSGNGVFQAAKAAKAFAIGVDSDQYLTADAAVRDVILTSMLKRVDVAVFDFVENTAQGNFKAGVTKYDLKVDGVGYATSGGKVDDIKPKLDDYKQQIIDGKIVVPAKPAAS